MEKKQIKISIIVPVYNVADYIRECLDSLVNQTYQNIEIILVDDGSTDLSGQICDEYAKKDRRIIVFHKTNGGLVSARKAGIRIATGEYVTYVDSDDWININAYEELVKIVIEYHPDIIAYDFIKEYSCFSVERRQPLQGGLYSKERFFVEVEKCVQDNMFFCWGVHPTLWSKLFKTELLRKYQLDVDEDICIGEDTAVVFPNVLNMKNIYIVKGCFYHYRVREKSIIRSREDNAYYRYLKLARLLIRANNNLEDWEERIKRYLVYVLYFYLTICVPELCFKEGKRFILFPEVNKNDRIIVYGKGVFADGIKKYIEQINFCHIVDNLDKMHIMRINNIPEESYEFIIIAILDFSVAQASIEELERRGINKNKILYIQKDNLKLENLPEEIWRDLF